MKEILEKFTNNCYECGCHPFETKHCEGCEQIDKIEEEIREWAKRCVPEKEIIIDDCNSTWNGCREQTLKNIEEGK